MCDDMRCMYTALASPRKVLRSVKNKSITHTVSHLGLQLEVTTLESTFLTPDTNKKGDILLL